MRPTQPPTLWLPGKNRQGPEADHSLSSNAEVNRSGAIPPLSHMSSWNSTYVIKHRDKFTFVEQRFSWKVVAYLSAFYAEQWPPTWATRIKSAQYFLKIHFNIVFSSSLSKWSHFLRFKKNIELNFPPLSMCHIFHQSIPSHLLTPVTIDGGHKFRSSSPTSFSALMSCLVC
jgi:hypothetical protein